MKIQVTLLSEPSRTFELDGRLGWAMAHLSMAGAKGVATIDRPACGFQNYRTAITLNPGQRFQ